MDFDNPYPEESLLGMEFDISPPPENFGLPEASSGNQPSDTAAPTQGEPKAPSKQESPDASPGDPAGQGDAEASVLQEKAPTGAERKSFYMLTQCWSNTGTDHKIEIENRKCSPNVGAILVRTTTGAGHPLYALRKGIPRGNNIHFEYSPYSLRRSIIKHYGGDFVSVRFNC